MRTRIGSLLIAMMLLMSSVTVWAAPSPSVSTDEEITSDVLVTSDKSVEEILEAVEVLVVELQESGELDEEGKLTSTGVAMVTSFLANQEYSVNGETLESGLVVQLTTDDREVAGLILSLDGELIGTIELGAIVVTNSELSQIVVEDGVISRPTITGLNEEIDAQMEQAITQLFGTEETLTTEEAEVYLREVLATISNITVAEGTSLNVLNIIDVSVSDYAVESLQAYSALAMVTVDLGILDSEYVVALHNYSDANWENLPCVNNGDGTVSFALSSFSPVAFVVSDEPIVVEEVAEEVPEEVEETEAVETTEEETSSSSMVQYLIIAVLVLGVLIFVISKKKKGE